MNQIARIINGPHLLFTGRNGSKTYGVTVQSTLSPDERWYRIGHRVAWYDNKSQSWITHMINNHRHQVGDSDYHGHVTYFLANHPEFK